MTILEAGQLEGVLQESEERFWSLFENTPIPIWEEDFSKVKNCIEGLIGEQRIDDFEEYLMQHPEAVSRCGGLVKVLDVNQAALKLHGAKSKKELLEHLEKTFAQESYETFSKVMVAIWRGETLMQMDAVVRTINGILRQVEVYWSVSPGHEHTFSRVMVSLIDITKRKLAEEELSEMAKIPGENPNPVMKVSKDGTIVYANKASQFLLSEWDYQKRLHLPEHLRQLISDVLVTGTANETEVKCDGRICSLTISPILDGGYVNIYGLDVTKRKRAEEELELRNLILSTQQETSLDGILVVDEHGNIISFNRRFVEIWNIPAEVITSLSDERAVQSVLAQLVDQEGFLARIKYLYAHREESSQEEIFLKDGRILDRYSAPMLGSDGKYYGRVWYFRDITVRRRALEAMNKYAEELKRSNELKDLFTDILRHDLLNPAGIVKGYTEMLLETEKDENKLLSLKAIKRNNQRLIDMIETASRFAKLESVKELEFKEMDIGVIFNGVVENFRSVLEEKKILLEFAADGVYHSMVNPVIEEAFANLLSNAIKYSPEKSRIIIDIVDAGENWKVKVTDFGKGISDVDKPKLFERFKRVDKGAVKGAGLGLAIVKRLITLHGGTVGIEDNPAGKGSVFWVTVKKA